MSIPPVAAKRIIIPVEKSIRRIFYQGMTTLDDMNDDRMQATIYGAVKHLAKPYKKMRWITRFLFKIRPADEIDKRLIPQLKISFLTMNKKVYNKLQKALVLIENSENIKPELFNAACEYYSKVATYVLRQVVSK